MSQGVQGQLKKALRRVRRQIRLLRAVRALCLGLLCGFAGVALWVGVSFVLPIERLFAWAGLTLAALAVLPPVVALCWPVSAARATRAADQCGLQERVLTAWSVPGESAMHALLRADAQARLNALDPKPHLPVVIEKKPMIACGALALLTAIALLLPNPQDGALQQARHFREEMAQVVERAEQRERPLADRAALTEPRTLEQGLLDKLRRANDARDAYAALDEAERRFEQLKQAEAERALQQVLSQAAQSAAGAEAAPSAALQQAAAALNGAEAAASAGQASELGDLSQLLAQLRQGVNAAGNPVSRVDASKGQSGDQGQGQNAGKSRAGGPNQGSGQGQEQGQGKGSGAGSGTSSADIGPGGAMQGKQGSGGSNPTAYRVRAYEAIYDPTSLERADDAQFAQGQLGAGESTQAQVGPGQGRVEGQVPYDRVVGHYQEAASRAAEAGALPDHMRQWVTQYFDSLID